MFEEWNFKKVDVVLPELYLLKLSLLRKLGEGCFKAPKMLFDKYFYYWISLVGRMFLLLKCLFLHVLYKKSTLSNHSFQRQGWYYLNFIDLLFLLCEYSRKVILRLQMFRWTDIFTIEAFVFANFVQKINFVLSQFQKLVVVVPEFSLFAISSLRLLEESLFKPLKVPVYEAFYQFNVYFCYICTKNWLWTIVLSVSWRGTTWILFICVVFMAGIKKKIKSFKSSVGQIFII